MNRASAAERAIEQAIQASKDRLENAVQGVATAAQLLTQVPGVRLEMGVIVPLEEWRELQEALGEWREATQGFLAAVTKVPS